MSTDLLKVPSKNGSANGGDASGRDDDVLSDVVLDDSRNVSAAPSRQTSVAPPGPSKLVNSTMADEDDEEEDRQDSGSDEGGDDQEDDEDEDHDEDASAGPGTPGKKMTVRQQEKAAEKKLKAAQRSAKKEQKREQKSNLGKHKESVHSKKAADSIKRFSYLLGQTDLFRHFIDLKKGRDQEFAKLLEESEKALATKKNGKGGKKGNARTRKSEKQEDAELVAEEDNEDDTFVFTESPAFVKGGTMRDYQVQGLNWMISLYHNGINGILADEMGLGKTLQTIAFLGYLKYYRNIPGPHLVVVPKSTLDNWQREFAHWVPGFKTFILRGEKQERARICQETILTQDFDVCITSYEICQLEKASLKKLSWEYIIIDEAHRIKNVNSILSQVVRVFDSRARLLITGTPLQNNLHELWALLNFLLPDVFSDVADFDAWFGDKTGGKHIDEADAEDQKSMSLTSGLAATGEDGEEDKNAVVKQLHKVLRPFLLRRVKVDVEKSLLPKKEINVYVGMTPMQRKWYKSLLERDIDAVNGMTSKKEGKTRLLNIVMQLRKCCNHPYLFDGAEPGPPYTTDEHLVDNAGKMQVLDKLLKSMKEKGSRVLIFSQMSRVLDILEDYCMFRDYQYCRIDGQTSHEDRIAAIDDYNKPDSEKFIFLLTTRAGGLGINLTTADVVVLYDSDWNPQADLQAMDRAHRIGQKKQVYVFRFITEDAVEEKVLERAAQKLRLDQLVIQQGRTSGTSKGPEKGDLVEMIQHGAQKIISGKEDMEIKDDIDEIIKRGAAKTAELNAKYANVAFDDLHSFKSELPATNVWEGETVKRKQQGLIWIEPTKRERKANPWANGAVRQVQQRRPRQLRLKGQVGDWQFFPPRLLELQELEANYNKKLQGYVVPAPDPKKMSDDAEAERAEEQAEIDQAEPLTEEEQAEKEELMKEGFNDWHKREYQGFIRGCEKFGRDNFEAIAPEIGTNKTAEDVKRYSEVFWERYKEIDDWERQINKILESEKQHAKNERLTQLLRDTVAKYKYPLQQLSITHPLSSRPRAYSDEEDRFLVCALARHGVGSDDVYEKIKKEILEWPMFRFDWFIKSRTPIEIGRRCSTLISLVQKEHAPEQAATDPARKARGRKKGENGDESKPVVKKRENGDAGSDAGSAPPPSKKLKSGAASRASSVTSSSRANSALPR